MASSIPGAKRALVALLVDLFPGALTSYGEPGMDMPDDIAAVMGSKSTVDRPTAGGASRSREEQVEHEIILSAYVAGDDVQQAATERAFEMLDALQDYLRTRGNETLGGVVRDSWVSAYEELPEKVFHPTDGWVTGRAGSITVTVTTQARI